MKHLTAIFCLTLAVILGSMGNSFALPPCPSDQNETYNNCFGKYTDADGQNYVGEWKDNKKNGQGTVTFPDGENYVGEFKDDLFSGQGTYTFSNGNKYVGEFKDDKKNGQGTFTFPV